MDTGIFDTFTQQLETGHRKEATRTLARFIASFADLEEKKVWTREYLETGRLGHKIRHELYEHVVFPTLLAGYRLGDPWSIRWLIRTVQNLYQAKPLWLQLEYKTANTLLRELFCVNPADDAVRRELLAEDIGWLRYAVHEWPAGILFAHDGAVSEECDRLAAASTEAWRLDREGTYSAFLDDFDSKLREYLARLQRAAALIRPTRFE